jgi:hypothetical protein
MMIETTQPEETLAGGQLGRMTKIVPVAMVMTIMSICDNKRNTQIAYLNLVKDCMMI